jgi:hypothetical protein
VQRPADLVAVEGLEVQRLRDDALAREGRVAVQDDRHRRGRVAVGVRALAGGLRRARGADDDRVHVLQVRRVGLEVDEDGLAVGQPVGALGAVVVLDVARPALRDGGDRLERRGALELGEDRLVRPAEVVGQDVERPRWAMPMTTSRPPCAAESWIISSSIGHRHVQALDGELLLAEVGLVHEALEGVDLHEALEQRLGLVVRERGAERPGLDALAQPGALAVRGDVLDLVGDRAAVRLAQVRQRVGERRARDVHPQDLGRDLRHELRREAEGLGIQRGIALGLRAERVQPRARCRGCGAP